MQPEGNRPATPAGWVPLTTGRLQAGDRFTVNADFPWKPVSEVCKGEPVESFTTVFFIRPKQQLEFKI